MYIYLTQLKSITSNTHYMNRYMLLMQYYLVNPANDIDYTESHHILPRALFPEFVTDPNNIVVLPYRAHYIAHWLLAKGSGSRSMIAAFNGMCNKNNHKHITSSTAYASAKRMFRDSQIGELNPSFGMVSAWNKITNTKVRVTKFDFYKNPQIYGGITCKEAIEWKIDNTGFVRKTQSQHQKTIASNCSMRTAPARVVSTGESIGRISKDDPRWDTGEIVSACLGIKKSITNRSKTYSKATCPACGKIGGAGNMKRYHFDKCRSILI